MTIQIPKYEDITVLVVGDVMLDRYWHGAPSRISPEAPVPVVHVQSVHESPGGAANVALNLKSIGCRVLLLGMVGTDIEGSILETSLHSAGVECHLQRIPDRSTITKLRVLGRNQQLIRLDFEQPFHEIGKTILLTQYEALLPQADIVIFSDYGKGALVSIQTMIHQARGLQKMTFVDPKSDSFSVYQGASIITPNLKEFEMVAGPCASQDELVSHAQRLIQQHNLEALLVTRGEEGMTMIPRNKDAIHLRAHASEVYDVSGAGDTVISILAATVAAGKDLETASILANMAAGIVVRKLGAATVSVPELRRAMQRFHGSELGILTEDDLIIAVEDARAHGEKIVMTNGCFDILHAGHVAYLEEARSLGHRLIVAVNDDYSVRRLKGETRPINSLANRMALLSALRFVDWVVAFSEDTPQRLITRVLPDVLVKAGDYTIDAIAGAKEVMANGGDVKLMRFMDGHSTTRIVQKIKGEEVCL